MGFTGFDSRIFHLRQGLACRGNADLRTDGFRVRKWSGGMRTHIRDLRTETAGWRNTFRISGGWRSITVSQGHG